LSRVLSRVLCPAAAPDGLSTVAADPGELPIAEVLTCRRKLSLLEQGRQFHIIGPWGTSVLDLLTFVHNDAFTCLGLPHGCTAEPVESANDARRLLSLASVGGAMLVGPLKTMLLPLLDSISNVARAIKVVDCVVHKEDGQLVGENVESLAFHSLLGSLGLSASSDQRVGLILGTGSPAAAARVALRALGFGNVLCLNAKAALPTFTISLPRPEGMSLGINISHDEGHSLRIEAVTGGAFQAWNLANPGLQVRPGDNIVALNGVRGEVAKLLEQCGAFGTLEVEVVRQETTTQLAGELSENLAVLQGLSTIGVLVLAEGVSEGWSDADACSKVLQQLLAHSKPVVIEASWPPLGPGSGYLATSLLDSARVVGCSIVTAAAFLVEECRIAVALWTGLRLPARPFAETLVRGWSCEAKELPRVFSEALAAQRVAAAEDPRTGAALAALPRP
jgi:shikimate 5-dehydrogenase